MAHASSSDDAASSRPVDDPRSTHLTVRENLVLAGAGVGLSVREIAEELRDSPEAVSRSLASAIEKLGAHSELEAVIIALRRGLIARPGDPADDSALR